MKHPPSIHPLWIFGILLLGISAWIFHRPPPPPKGPTQEEAALQAAPAVLRAARNLATAPALPPTEGPAIRLRTATLSPAGPLSDSLPPVHERPSARGYPWMVLFDAPIQPEWNAMLEKAGATVRAYLPDHALLIEAPAQSLSRLRSLAHVAWSGEYRPAYKVQPLLAALARENPSMPLPVTLQTFSPDDVEGLVRQLTDAGGSDIRATPARRWGIVRAVLQARTAVELARLPEVQWVEQREIPRFLNDQARAASHLNIDAARDGHGLDGTDQIVAIADTGIDTGDTNTIHPDFAGRIFHVFDTGRLTNWSDTYYHGTHAAGSLAGSGAASDGQYRGAAPAAKLVLQSVMTAANTMALPDDLNDFYSPPYGVGARIHSDSWGSAVFGQYTADSMTSDEFIWDHPDLLVAFAAGNEGVDYDRNGVVDLASLDAPGSAKNVLTVGASESGRPAGSGGYSSRTYGNTWLTDYRAPPISTDYISASPTDAPQGMAAFSSRGPAADGRTKPDIVAPGTDIISARSRASSSTGWGVLDSNTNYCFMGGTSMATPLAAGSATLVRQYCMDFLGLAQPSAALLKATLVGGARSLFPGQYGTNQFLEIPELPRPNVVEGWGQVDVDGTLFTPPGFQAVLMEGPAPLSTGSSTSFVFSVHSNAPLNVAMAYSDYPSALSAGINLVNDLDLLLISPGGTRHYPNGLDRADTLNNVEGIDIASAQTGLWTLVVSARNVPQGPQPYALYLRGALHMPVVIGHTPLPNTWITNQAYLVSASLSTFGLLDTNTVFLHWNTTGSTNLFTTLPLQPAANDLFEAEIPMQPLGTRIHYYLSAGSPDLPARHPEGAPAELHSFEITSPLALAVSGLPSNKFTVDPPYGVQWMASNVLVRASTTYPLLGSNGWRTACVGWQGGGSVPPTGTADFCNFTMTGPSIITWLWQQQTALMHTSSPGGAMASNTWHEAGSIASSLWAPESHTSSNNPLTFAGWTLDGMRWPSNQAPSRLQIHDIPMTSPHLATATYLPTAQDSDSNHLPDWFEFRYFGQLAQNRYGDPDLDSYENELEAADHTDPLDPASTPAPPVIRHDPLPPLATSPAPWTISADITDNYHVASATLHWQRNGGLLRSAAMAGDPDQPARFTAQIPSPVRSGDQVVYFISALDDAGFYAQSTSWTVSVAYARLAASPASVEVSALAHAQTNVSLLLHNPGNQPLVLSIETSPIGFADNAESGTNGWTLPDGNHDWHISAQRANSPTQAWYCGQETTRLYLNSTHAALVSPPIHLAALAPRLDFVHYARFEADQDRYPDGIHYWDSGIVEITDNDGQTWQSLPPEGGYPGLVTSNPVSPFAPDTPCLVNTTNWDPVGADLSAYANREIRLRFRFGADMYTVAEGWRIDDIIVSPRTEYTGWLSLSATNIHLDPGLSTLLILHLDTTVLPPMASGHLALSIHHNDPEQTSPLVVPVALHNTSRRVRITTEGEGVAAPDGESLLAPDTPFSVNLSATEGCFIADIQTNSALVPLPDVVSTQTLQWISLSSNLDIHAVFAPRLADDLVPPEWLAFYGLTNRNGMAESSLDQDGDGLLTWQEEQTGSSPIDPADARLWVNLLPPESTGTEWRITWQAFTNRSATYSILSTSNLVDGFVLFTNLVAAPPVMTSPPLPPDHLFFGLQKQEE